MQLQRPLRNISNLTQSLGNILIQPQHIFQMINFFAQPMNLLIFYFDISLKLGNQAGMVTRFNCGHRRGFLLSGAVR